MRALAISVVVAFHSLVFPITGHSALAYLGRLPSAGWGGVDIFFVLSGFLVGGILIDSRGQPNAMRRFLIRRFMRIIPLYWLMLASFYLVPLAFSYPADEWPFGGPPPWWSYVTLTQNFATPIQGHDAFYLGPTWSLAVEAQIYLLLGFLLTRAPARLIRPIMIAGVAIAEISRLVATVSGHGIFGYFLLPARIDGACMGVIVALLVRDGRAMTVTRRHSSIIWSAIVFVAVSSGALSMAGQGIGSLGANFYTHFTLALASAAMIAVLIGSPEGTVNRVLRMPALVSIGTVSYGIYLMHRPVTSLAHVLLANPSVEIGGWREALATVIGVVLTLIFAQLSWRYFETPLISWSHRITANRKSSDVFPQPSPV